MIVSISSTDRPISADADRAPHAGEHFRLAGRLFVALGGDGTSIEARELAPSPKPRPEVAQGA
ncbi:MAG TPA: hypothetical protein VGR35_11725 [Tepidisphaeraceae bacterium]|nr:hypothetical protein [Tepidisphaeraceae bacterium]